MTLQNPFSDAKLLYDRAQKQIAEYNKITGTVWKIERSGPNCKLILNREALVQLRPVAADISNNLIHALDQVAAACARLNGHGRNRRLHYPVHVDDSEFHAHLISITGAVGMGFADVFEKIRKKHASLISSLRVVKEFSNSAKHWRIAPTIPLADAIGYTLPGADRQTIVEIPKQHFDHDNEFKFLVPASIPTNIPFLTIIGFRIEGLPIEATGDPSSIFSHASLHVREIIDEVEKLAGWP